MTVWVDDWQMQRCREPFAATHYPRHVRMDRERADERQVMHSKAHGELARRRAYGGAMVTPQDAIKVINDAFGRHPSYRALHAKGVLCQGTFTASAKAAGLTRAAHMQGQPVPALIRFSNGSGKPSQPDFLPQVRGMAVKFSLPDGSRTDTKGNISSWSEITDRDHARAG
jgi:hypothetical protein